MSKDNKLMVLALVGVAYYMSRRPAMGYSVPRTGTGLAPMNSLPGNIGTGAGQVLGGALGGLMQGLFGGSTSQYVPNTDGATNVTPNWDAAYQQNPELMDNVMLYGV